MRIFHFIDNSIKKRAGQVQNIGQLSHEIKTLRIGAQKSAALSGVDKKMQHMPGAQ
jgi:hypothetical protein